MMRDDIPARSRISRQKRLFLKLISAAVIVMIAAYFYDSLSLNKIPPKDDPTYLRIGYANLHASKVTLADLEKLDSYNCDLWLFLEWNGDNFVNYTDFLSSYPESYEFTNRDTYGVLVLFRTKEIKVLNKGSGKPEACNYPIQLIQYGTDSLVNIYLAHAPPPVPSCKTATKDYLDKLTSLISETERGGNIVIGDFNTLPFQKGIGRLKDRGYSDAQQTLGLMPQGTFSFFPWLPNLIKIDYVFHKGRVVPKKLARFSISNSDHSGWVADFKLP